MGRVVRGGLRTLPAGGSPIGIGWVVAVLAALAVTFLAGAGSAAADHEIPRVEGKWTRAEPDPGEIEFMRNEDGFAAVISEDVENRCFSPGRTLYEFTGHEPEYTGKVYYAVVDSDPGPEVSLYEARASRELDAGDRCTGEFVSRPATFLLSAIGNRLQFGGGAGLDVLRWLKDRVDTDADGLYDDEERSGINIPADPETFELSPETEVDLQRMGADPQRKDLFVEVDAMSGHEMSPEAVAGVEQVFDGAPVTNPDRSRGISLHIDAGPGTTMDFASGRRWGELSESDVLPHRRVLGSLVGSDDYDWTEYQEIKARHFDNCPPDDGVCKSARSLAFRYMVIIHGHPAEDAGGESLGIPAIDSVNAFQCPGVRTECTIGVADQGAAFMHEFGHNLGLEHGGPTDGTNHKPNHFSVMNYNYGLGIPTPGSAEVIIDYSRFDSTAVPDLVERSLNERSGVRASLPRPVLSIYHCQRSGRERRVRVNRPADFNCNGSARGTVATDINDDGNRGTLSTDDEWQDLVLDPRFIFPVGSPAHRAASASGRTPRLVAPRVEEPGYFDTRGLIYGDRKKPKLRIKKSRRGRRVRIKVRARDNKNVDRLIVDLGKPVDRYIERDPGRKRRKLSFKESVPKGTRVGVVALDQAGNAREKRFRARGRRRGPK